MKNGIIDGGIVSVLDFTIKEPFNKINVKLNIIYYNITKNK